MNEAEERTSEQENKCKEIINNADQRDKDTRYERGNETWRITDDQPEFQKETMSMRQHSERQWLRIFQIR